MGIELDDQAARSENIEAEGSAEVCEACQHDLSLHDATAIRYCRVSSQRSLDRRCMCPATDAAQPSTEAASQPTGQSGSPMYGRGRFSGR
ncbi:RGCVC family protein [Pseudonocardia sp.]|uniref:RGCVC family protein n=1 Tax=Pseudonocardia sp. TaxID=60912 RepID=UPI0039C8D4D8